MFSNPIVYEAESLVLNELVIQRALTNVFVGVGFIISKSVTLYLYVFPLLSHPVIFTVKPWDSFRAPPLPPSFGSALFGQFENVESKVNVPSLLVIAIGLLTATPPPTERVR